MATLSTTSTLQLRWAWTDTVGLSDVTNAATLRWVTSIDDAAVCNVAWADSRTLAANTVETIDLANLPYSTLGLGGTFSFSRIHKIYIANVTTSAALTAGNVLGAELRVGVPDNLTVGHYAMSVWHQSHSYQYSKQGWVPADLLRIANVSSVTIPYHIILLGQGEVESA